MSEFSRELTRLMTENGIGVRALARAVWVNAGHISNLRSGKTGPSPELAALLDTELGADGRLAALVPAVSKAATASEEIAALELARRSEASDVSDGTCERLEMAVDDLATAYPRTAPDELLPRIEAHIGYTTQLIDGKATLKQRRRLLVSGGWLSLLAATVLIDLHREPAAASYLRTAAQLAAETGHAETAAWELETRAWMAITLGDYRQTLKLSRAAQETAPKSGSAYIQAIAQEGRAHARLGDARATRDALGRVERLASPLAVPDRPEHHYHYDPAKAEAYVVTTLSWIADPAAEQAAREVLTRLEQPAIGPPRRRRATAARLDLALALTGQGKHDEAAGTALEAVTSGYFVPSHYWRAQEIIDEVTDRGVPEARDLADAYRIQTARPGT